MRNFMPVAIATLFICFVNVMMIMFLTFRVDYSYLQLSLVGALVIFSYGVCFLILKKNI